MHGRGLHFAISPAQADALVDAAPAARRAMLDELEDAWAVDDAVESDDTWDVIHRCLSGEDPPYPLDHVVLGPRRLDVDACAISLVHPDEVVAAAAALEFATPEWMTARYQRVAPTAIAELAYTLANLDDIRALFRRAAARGAAIVFTVETDGQKS